MACLWVVEIVMVLTSLHVHVLIKLGSISSALGFGVEGIEFRSEWQAKDWCGGSNWLGQEYSNAFAVRKYLSLYLSILSSPLIPLIFISHMETHQSSYFQTFFQLFNLYGLVFA
jgi:hypothetical protein